MSGASQQQSNVQWRWVDAYAKQFEACDLTAGEVAVLLYEAASSPLIVENARLALEMMGAAVAEIRMPTPPNPGPLPIRSTGASQAIAGHRAVINALQTADFVVDATAEGLLHAPELGQILSGTSRVLMISAEHPENAERWPHDPSLKERVDHGIGLLNGAKVMTISSEAGTDLTIDLEGAFKAGSCGFCTKPGEIAHWPGGLVVAFPASGTVNGTVVLASGDINLTFNEYIREPITLTVENDYVTNIEGDHHDAELMRSYLAAFGEADAYAISHIGWGMNHAARWEALAMWDKQALNGTELRAFAGNVVFSTGANEVAGRFCRGHFDLPMRHCTVALDGDIIVDAGVLRDDLQ